MASLSTLSYSTPQADPSSERERLILAHLPQVRGPSEVRDQLVELIAAGVSHIVLAALPPIPPVQWLAEEIVEPVLARVRDAS